MNKFQNLPLNERVEALEANADAVSVEKTERPLTELQSTVMKNRLAEIGMRDVAINEEIKVFTTPLKNEQKDLTLERLTKLKTLRDGYTESEEKLYHFFDQEKGNVDSFDSKGEFVKSRKMRPDERQTTVLSLQSRTGTND